MRLFLAITLVLATLTGCAPVSDTLRSDLERLQGEWQLVYQEMNGKKLPDEEQAEMFHGRMVFVGDKIHYSAELPGFSFRFSYVLHPDQHPKKIDLMLAETSDGEGVGETILGIYRLREDRLEICHGNTTRPTDFTAEEGLHQVLVVLKRAASSP